VCEAVVRCGVTTPVHFACVRPSPELHALGGTLYVCEAVARGGVRNRTVALRVCEAVARGGVCNRTVALRVCEAVVRCGVTAPVLFACVRPSSGVAVLSWALVAVWRLAVPGLSGAGANEGTGEDLF